MKEGGSRIMQKFRFVLLLPLAGLIVYSAFAGEIEEYFRAEPDRGVPIESDWRQDARLQDHGVTEIGFERLKSQDRTRWQAYSVRFFNDGRVEYTGYDYVRKMGSHVGRIPMEEFQRLALLIEEMNFDGLESGYYKPAVRSPMTYTSVVRNDGRKTVQNYADAGPVRLWAIELAIQDLVRKITWES
jgi:hypothetical protein